MSEYPMSSAMISTMFGHCCFSARDSDAFMNPGVSLLFLVSALAGRERILNCYTEAISRGYRFFSYGDAMAVITKPK